MRRLLLVLAGLLMVGCSGDDESTPTATGSPVAGGLDDADESVTAGIDPAPVPTATTVPQDPFCVAWWDEVVNYQDQWSATATSDPVSSLLLLVTAPYELADMFERLADDAPSELVADLEELAEYFDGVFDNAGDAVDNPLKFLVAGAVDGLRASGPMGRVDSYITANCPVPAQLAAAGASYTSAACQRVINTDVDADSDVAEFASFLDDVEAAAPQAAEPARDLRLLIGEMSPPARFGFEALGRLRFTDANTGDRLFSQAVNAAVSACVPPGAAAPADTVAALLARIGPEPGNKLSRTLYGRCESVGLLVPHHNIYRCAEQTEIVDLSSGTIDVIDAEVPLHLRSDHRYGWSVSVIEHPASGLEQPAWSAELNYVNFVDRSADTIVVVDRQVGLPGAVTGVFADADRVVVRYEPYDRSDPELITYSTAGDVIAKVTASDAGEPGNIFAFSSTTVMNASIVFSPAPQILLNPADGSFAPISTYSRLVPKLGLCPNDDYFAQGSFEHYSHFVTTDPLSLIGPVAALRPVGGGWLDGGSSRDRDGWRLYEIDDWGDELQRPIEQVRADATERWFLSNDVITRADVTFGWITVLNQSGEVIVVDPATGAEADPATAPVDLVKRLYESRGNVEYGFREIEHVDQVAGLMFLGDRNQVEVVELAALCPTDWNAVAAALPVSASVRVRAFSAEMSGLFARGEFDALVARLHPNVLAVRPAQQCRDVLAHPDAEFRWEPIAEVVPIGSGQLDFGDAVVEFGNGYHVFLDDRTRFTVSLDSGGPYWFAIC